MTTLHVAVCNVALIILFFVKNSIQECKYYKTNIREHHCTTLQDFYNYHNLMEVVVINGNGETSDLEELQVVPIRKAEDIKYFAIDGAISGVPKDAFKNFENIKTLQLTNNRLDVLPAPTLSNIAIERIFFSNNGIQTIPSGAFTNLTQLESLHINYENFTRITKEVFDNLNLNTLNLRHDQISDIDKFSFGNMSNLKTLVLSENHLHDFVPQELFYYPPHQLEGLFLTNNKLTDVKVKGLTNLRRLELCYNSISFIEPRSFAETPKLEILTLGHNQLEVISEDIFPTQGLNSLTYLRLDHNRLTYLSSDFFMGLNNLREAWISGNPWQCPCLDSVLKILDEKNVLLSKCDRDVYISGQRPICVVPDVRNTCVLSYDKRLYETYQRPQSRYPLPKLCRE